MDLESRLRAGTSNAAIVEEPLVVDWRARKPSFSIIALTLLWKSQAWWEWQQALMTTCDFQNELCWRHGRPGRPVLWESFLVKIFGSHWMKIAISREWFDNKTKLVDGACATLGIRTLDRRFGKQAGANIYVDTAAVKKMPRQVEWEPQHWALDDNAHRLGICGDSKAIVNWFNGLWPVRFLPYLNRVSAMHRQLHELVQQRGVRPLRDSSDFCRHVFRELNGDADAMANRHSNTWHLDEHARPGICMRGFSDGSVRGKRAAFGWIPLASSNGDDDMTGWRAVAYKSGCLPDGASITAAELKASFSLFSFLHACYQSYAEPLVNICLFPSMDYNIIPSLETNRY